jgi:4'-phosphopantetheinyl transferase EntD
VIEQVLPRIVVSSELFGDAPAEPLFPQEAAGIARAVPQRREEFARGRTCLRRALVRLGRAPQAVPRGEGGAPQWPGGVTGSLTHCRGYCGAAVADTRAVETVGIDAEPNELLPPLVLGRIASHGERERLRPLREQDPTVNWDRLLFSAKEAAIKCSFARSARPLALAEIAIDFDARGETFTASVPRSGAGCVAPTILHGRWLAAGGLLMTAAVITVTRP